MRRFVKATDAGGDKGKNASGLLSRVGLPVGERPGFLDCPVADSVGEVTM